MSKLRQAGQAAMILPKGHVFQLFLEPQEKSE